MEVGLYRLAVLGVGQMPAVFLVSPFIYSVGHVRDLLLRAKHLFVAASWSPMGAAALTQRSPLGAFGAAWVPLIALVATQRKRTRSAIVGDHRPRLCLQASVAERPLGLPPGKREPRSWLSTAFSKL